MVALAVTHTVSTVAEPTGAGNFAVQISPSGATTSNGVSAPWFHGMSKRERRQHRTAHRAHQPGAGAVDEARRLLARTGIVERDAVAALGDAAVERVEHIGVAVVLEEIGGVEFAVRQFAQARAHARFR